MAISIFSPPRKIRYWKMDGKDFNKAEDLIDYMHDKLDGAESLYRDAQRRINSSEVVARSDKKLLDMLRQDCSKYQDEANVADERVVFLESEIISLAKGIKLEGIISQGETSWGCYYCGAIELNDIPHDEPSVHFDGCIYVKAIGLLFFVNKKGGMGHEC